MLPEALPEKLIPCPPTIIREGNFEDVANVISLAMLEKRNVDCKNLQEVRIGTGVTVMVIAASVVESTRDSDVWRMPSVPTNGIASDAVVAGITETIPTVEPMTGITPPGVVVPIAAGEVRVTVRVEV